MRQENIDRYLAYVKSDLMYHQLKKMAYIGRQLMNYSHYTLSIITRAIVMIEYNYHGLVS